jgi:hypothetical protein
MPQPKHARIVSAVTAGALVTALCTAAHAATLSYGVLTASQKVRPSDKPSFESKAASLKAARNEFEAFQVILRSTAGATQELTLSLDGPLQGPGGAVIAASNVTLYRQMFYQVAVASNSEGAAGRWPDALIPAVDAYFGEPRTAFPMDVPDNETRAVWVEVLVPVDAEPGSYAGSLSIRIGTQQVGKIDLSLRVGAFTLPSTASLASAFGMGWSAPCRAHTGTDSCDSGWNEEKANELRALYLRAGLDHRFTISDVEFQPPFGSSAAPFEKWVMPLLDGSGPTRLPGARLTAVRLDGGDGDVAKWLDYAKAKGFADRLFYYPVDEPSTPQDWEALKNSAQALHAADPSARVIITSTIHEAAKHYAADEVDIFAPVINYLEGKLGSGQYEGDQTGYYADWLTGKSNRSLWAYQSCMSHGCGECGAPTTDSYFTGWPQRVIDSTAVQDRCFPWVAFRLGITGELYFAATEQLETAWSNNGQCAFSGSGDGTLFYPGKASLIGGTRDIPVESIRMKMIREGMEDYEYLVLVAAKDPIKARTLANTLFPWAWQCAQSPGKLETARDAMFAFLDGPVDAGAPDADSGKADGASDGPPHDALADGLTDAADGPDSAPLQRDTWGGESSDCSCGTVGGLPRGYWGMMAVVAGLVALGRRRGVKHGS